ncbi:MAG: CHASE2 domain-containing protein [Cyclobacteriaceae bacterium]|nr:CHASE2 domain-containing protein [Cyclobacteriaceae bacterium]
MSKWKKIWLDNVLGTAFIFALMGGIVGLGNLPIFNAFDPIGQALSDMEMTDLVFSQLREEPEIDTNVVVINIGNLPRSGIGHQLNIINQYHPAVVAFDFDFLDLHPEDPEGDSILASAISNTKKLVMISKLLQTDSLFEASPGIDLYDSMSFSAPYLSQGVTFAFANLETEAEYQDDFKACRAFPPQRDVNGKLYNAFALEIANQYNPKTAEKLISRGKDWETINYRGNVVDFFGRTNYPTSYYALDWDQVLNEEFAPEMIKDKIVIFGFLGESFFDTSWDDKFFTPLNKNYAGKTNPDMYGAVIHANIVSMILKGDYVDTWNESIGFIVGFLVCFLNVVFFSWIYRHLPRWYDGLTKIMQIIELAILVAFMIYAFHLFNFKLNLTVAMAGIALAGDGLEVYYGVVKNLFRKESRRQLFTIQRD